MGKIISIHSLLSVCLIIVLAPPAFAAQEVLLSPSNNGNDLVHIHRDGNNVLLTTQLSRNQIFYEPQTWRQEIITENYDSKEVAWLSGDFNGDGKKDLATVYRSGRQVLIYVWPSNNTGFDSRRIWINDSTFNGYAATEKQWLVGDINGDRRDDVYTVFRDGETVRLYVWESTGTGFKSWNRDNTIYTTFNTFSSTEIKWLAADVTGDHKDDLITVYRQGVRVVLYVWEANDRGKFDPCASWIDIGNPDQTLKFNTYGTSEVDWLSGDVDGDGRQDMTTVYRSGAKTILYVWRAQTKSFAYWTNCIIETVSPVYIAGTEQWRCGDLDANGKADVLQLINDGTTLKAMAWLSLGWPAQGYKFSSGARKLPWYEGIVNTTATERACLLADVGSYTLPTRYALVNIYKETGTEKKRFSAGVENEAIGCSVNTQAGDVLIARGQIAATKDVLGTQGSFNARILSDLMQISPSPAKDLLYKTPEGNHHGSMWLNGAHVSAGGSRRIKLMVTADNNATDFELSEWASYILVEQYRPLANAGSQAYLLSQHIQASNDKSKFSFNNFPLSYSSTSPALTLNIPAAQKNDIFYVTAQGAGECYLSQTYPQAMYGLKLRAVIPNLGPAAPQTLGKTTENISAALNLFPQHLFGLWQYPATATYSFSEFRLYPYTADYTPDRRYIIFDKALSEFECLHYKPSAQAPNGAALTGIWRAYPDLDLPIKNTGNNPVDEISGVMVKTGGILRVCTEAMMQYTSSSALQCYLWTEIYRGGVLQARSVDTLTSMITPYTKRPIYNEKIFSNLPQGTYTIKTLFKCTGATTSNPVNLLKSGSWMHVYQFE